MTRTSARRLLVVLALLPLLAALLPALAGCGSSGNTVEDDEYDRKIRRSYLQPRQLAFFEGRFASDREEMQDYINAFSNEELSGVMKDELVEMCRTASSPILAANLAYMIARAGIERVIPFIEEELRSDDRYVRWRGLLSIAPAWTPRFQSAILPLTSVDEPDPEVRRLARDIYTRTITADDFQPLFDALGGEDANDETYRAFLTTCLLDSLRAMDGAARDERTMALAHGIGQGSQWQDAFTLELLQGKVPAGALPALIRAWVTPDRSETLRRLVALEVCRHVSAGVTVPSDLVEALRARAVEDLTAGTFDPDRLGELLRAVGLDDPTTERLTAWLGEQNVGNPEAATPAALVVVRMLADLAPPSEALASRLIEATGNPQLEHLAVTRLVSWLGENTASGLPRDGMIDAIGQALESEEEATRLAAAMGLAKLHDNELAQQMLLEALRSGNEGAVDASADALVEHGDRAALKELEIDLCDIVRLDGPRPMAAFNIIAGLRLLEVVGGEYTLDFMSQYCRPQDATVDVAVQLERTRKAIEQRLGR